LEIDVSETIYPTLRKVDVVIQLMDLREIPKFQMSLQPFITYSRSESFKCYNYFLACLSISLRFSGTSCSQ